MKNAFDLDRLIDRHRRPGMNEECEVYEVSVPDEALTDEDEDIPTMMTWTTRTLLYSALGHFVPKKNSHSILRRKCELEELF